MMRLWIAAVASVLIGLVGTIDDAGAASGQVSIQAVRAGTAASASEEFVMLRNMSDMAVDISGWKVTYESASSKPGDVGRTLVVFATILPDHVLLPGGTTETLFSNNLATTLAVDASALRFTPGINAAGGTVSLRDASGTIVDQVGWGTATLFEGEAAPALGTQALVRRGADTDNNKADFYLASADEPLKLTYGSLTDVTDVCTNIEGIQVEVPSGLVRYTDGNCRSPDVCSNLDGIQEVVPDGYEELLDGTCQQIDLCDNIDGIQTDTSMYEVVGTQCFEPFQAADIRLNELLPNPPGVDTGNEFIELYNASDEAVSLDDYYLKVDTKTYAFPVGSSIAAGEYRVFSDIELKLAFANATGKAVELVGRDGARVSLLPAYQNAPDDQSWASIDDAWQYTNRPTPGATNLASLLGSGSVYAPTLAECPAGKYRNPETNRCKAYEESTLTPCKAGQERNPDTNRCRTVAAATASLTPCKEGQYRNPLTNRCKSISAELASLTPCKEGQERNPETNRCRKIATASTLQPCAEGQERNPETNRCRKVASATPPAAAFAVEPIADTASTFTAWWVLGGAVALVAGYAGWEYRREVGAFARRIFSRGKV